MLNTHSLLTEPLVSELIEKRQQLSRQLQRAQKTLATLEEACGNASTAEKISRWDAMTELKTQQITLSSKIELINELIALGERAVSDLPWVPQYRR